MNSGTNMPAVPASDDNKNVYELYRNSWGFLPERFIKERLTKRQIEILRHHALAFACLDGNSFPGLIDQYMGEAYANLWNNGSYRDEGLPLLYPCDAADGWWARLPVNHPQYEQYEPEYGRTQERREELLRLMKSWRPE